MSSNLELVMIMEAIRLELRNLTLTYAQSIAIKGGAHGTLLDKANSQASTLRQESDAAAEQAIKLARFKDEKGG